MYRTLEHIINKAFRAASEQLKKLNAKQKKEVKKHPQQEANPLVLKIFPELGYGFLETLDGREVYFHENSVHSGAFSRLKPGTAVRYMEEPGEKGPQAISVKLTDQVSDH
ncbi:MAG: hypothetical protein GF408_05250 [Candidatus Omnitrophica bacterium]|nr:hypothetical protein [Candidatus Omnitrophota bacterium]